MARPIVAPVQRSNIRKVLIIDDDDELRESLREGLSLHDEFDMQFAATASEGLKLASSGRREARPRMRLGAGWHAISRCRQ
jgi:ActR/RegA family two-component response regulator